VPSARSKVSISKTKYYYCLVEVRANAFEMASRRRKKNEIIMDQRLNAPVCRSVVFLSTNASWPTEKKTENAAKFVADRVDASRCLYRGGTKSKMLQHAALRCPNCDFTPHHLLCLPRLVQLPFILPCVLLCYWNTGISEMALTFQPSLPVTALLSGISSPTFL